MYDAIKRIEKNNNELNKNVRKLGTKKGNSPRKTRSDKKTDIKIPLISEQRVRIRKYSMNSKMAATNYCSYLVKKGLDRAIPFPIPIVNYPSGSDLSFHVKLEESYIALLDDLCVEWDCSRKKAAYRILVTMLDAEGVFYGDK